MSGFMIALLFLPVLVVLFSPQNATLPIALNLLYLFVLLAVGLSALFAFAGARRARAVITVTDRRVLVNASAEGPSSSMTLDNLVDVQFREGLIQRAAGIADLFLMPEGATAAFVGSGRYRQLAPGVVPIFGLARAHARTLRDLLLVRAAAAAANEARLPLTTSTG